MTKQGGMGDLFLVDGYDMSGDVGSLSRIGGGPAASEVTGINSSGIERIGLLRDGAMEFNTWFNDAIVAPVGAFTVLKTLPTTDRQGTYCRGQTLGKPAASAISKQIDYAGTRAQDASFTFACSLQANGYGIEWGEQLTAGKRTDTVATNGTGIDYGATSTLFGWAAYLHVTSFTGTSVTVTVQDSADNATFATITGGAFTANTAVGQERIQSSSTTATVRRYVRVITTGTFSSATFVVNFVRYLTAQP